MGNSGVHCAVCYPPDCSAGRSEITKKEYLNGGQVSELLGRWSYIDGCQGVSR